MPLGILAGMSYASRVTALEPGDLVLCYSDGATDSRDRADTPFGEQQLVAVAAAHRKRAPREIVDSIRTEIDRHQGDAPRVDDITLVVLKRDAGGPDHAAKPGSARSTSS